ncbi:MFS transporter [Aquicoccus sp. SCR17]|nr:MFS transporter [Carideicomes alvinocaridis]
MQVEEAPHDPAVPFSSRPPICAPESRPWLLVTAILASALGFIDGTVVAVALPSIRETLGATLPQAQWVTNAYLLLLCALILTGGTLADRFGLARVFGSGIALFVLASLGCAAAPTPGVLILARAVQGFGAALMVPGSLALVSRAYPREERGRAIGTWAAASALTTAIGPIVGGLALSLGPEMWRWIFAVNLPLGGLALLLLFRHARVGTGLAGVPVDGTGAVLATLGLLLLAWGLTLAGRPGSYWPLWSLAGLAIFALFLRHEARVRDPMLPLDLFRHPVFAAANLLSFFLYFALSTMLFFLPMYVVPLWPVNELEATAAFAPQSVFLATLSRPVGAWADRHGPRGPIALGAALVACGDTLVAWTAPQMDFWGHTLPAMALAGLGMALVVAPLSAAVMGAAEESRTGAASGVNNAVSRMSGLVAVALLGAVAAMAYRAAGGPLDFGVPAEGAEAAHRAASLVAFRWVVGIAAGLAALASVTALLGLRRAETTTPA